MKFLPERVTGYFKDHDTIRTWLKPRIPGDLGQRNWYIFTHCFLY